MDLKPKVTCFGNKDVYNSLNPELERRLPREFTEWRRSYGRPPKTVKLKAHFVHLSQDMLVDVSNPETYQSASSLHRQPFFHIYWTDCQDPDEFKSTVKDGITDWMRKLRERNIIDWMIIQVISQDSLRGSKPKIPIPRSSVFDKIKSDFGGKNNDRIIQLWEPLKENQAPRSVESWQNLVIKLRQLLLLSFNRHLGKFEDQVRSLREKRTEPRWSFTTYFLLHEELSFVFEMLGLYEEALIQYDEIDALLTQLVINSKFGEPLDCIDVFMCDCKCCDGVSLAKGAQEFLRQLIKTQEASYVDLRNYLFSRQCKLLLKLNRPTPWEIAQRTLEFLHNLKHELAMDTLKISMPTGGASCSAFLTSLEVLKACRNQNNENGMAYSLHFALLYQYAREKLDDLGNLCGLMPGMTPSETELQTVCMLLASIGKTQGEDVEPNSPTKRLHEALSSRRVFELLYLDLTELAITIYNNIGRARAAKLLGVDLAQFHCCREEFDLAEPLLYDAYKMYKHERWTLLATKCLVKLAQCQKQLTHTDKYASSCAILACEQHLSSEERSYYTQELVQVMRETMDSEQPIIVRAEPMLRVEDVQIDLMKGIGSVGESINIRIKLFSALEEEVTCGRISFSIQTSELKRVGSIRSSKRIRAASPPYMENGLSSAALSEEDLSDKAESQTPDGEGFSNVNREEIPHLLVPEQGSRPEMKSSEELAVLSVSEDDAECCLECFNVPLKYGINDYNLTAQLAEEGHYYLKQLCVEIGRLDFVWPQLPLRGQSRGFAIVDDSPRICWSPPGDLYLLAGLPQEVTLSISVEPGSIANGSVLEISTQKKGISFEPISSGQAVIHSSIDKQDNIRTAPYSVQVPTVHGQEDVTNIAVALVTLPAVGPYAKIDLKLIIHAPLEKQSLQEEVTEYLLTFSCKWLSPVVTANLSCSFHRPFTVRHVLHSSETSRFVQVIVSGINPVDLVIPSPEVIITNCSTVKLTALHRSSEYVIIDQQDMSFLWKIESKEGSLAELDCEFRVPFTPKQISDSSPSSSERIIYLYDFRLVNNQALYTISSRIEPLGESGDLFAGSTYKWHITFTRLWSRPDTTDPSQLLYDVDSDTNTWAISGRKSGVVRIPCVSMATTNVVLNVIPQTGGHLAMPAIKLMKYLEKDETLPQKILEADASTGVTASGTQASRDCPLILPFSCGQVYNKTLGIRVRVLPNNNTDYHCT